VVIGVVLFGTMALVTPFMQNVVGYPILTAGILLASRGVGTLIAMLIVGRLLKIIEARYLVLAGLTLATLTLNWMVDFTDQTAARTIVATSIVQGFGLGFVFVPLSTVAFVTLPNHLRVEGSAILTLVRNLGSSVGISIVIAQLTNTTIRMHAHLAEYVTPFNDALQAPTVSSILSTTTQTGRAMLDALVTQQAAIIAYANDFKLLMYLTLATIPLVFFIGSSRMPRPRETHEPAHALD
jgi:DHA2 family multidrug resistance protein